MLVINYDNMNAFFLSLVVTETGGTSDTDSKPMSKPGKQEVADSPPPVAPGVGGTGRRGGAGATPAEMFWKVVHDAPRESEKKNSGTKRRRR